MIKEIFIKTFNESLMITLFVLFMMVLIEYFNIQNRNRWSDKLKKSPFSQIILAALLGITPGCMGAFTVVSLYTHHMMGLAALVTVMIATSGDEAFVMFALFPMKAILLHIILLVTAIASGWIVHMFNKNNEILKQHGFLVHDEENCSCFSKKTIIPQLKNISFERAVLILCSILFIIFLVAGIFSPFKWSWKQVTFLAGGLFMLFVFITVSDHFLKEHLYDHILKKHLLRIFFWTWGAFIVLHYAESNIELNNLVQNNTYLILLIAVLFGLIPESGPHLVFVTLFSQNILPFSILLANSIVQDGHGMLPLLAESRKDFIKVKGINMLIGFLVGLLFLQFGG